MAQPAHRLSVFERTVSLFTKVRPGEGPCLAVLLLHAFLLMLAYYLIRPVREALILTEGSAELRSYAVGVQALLLILLIPIYGAVFRFKDNSLLIQRVNAFFVLNLLVFAGLGFLGVKFAFVFFIWASIFGVMVVAQFWAFATDLFNVKSGQRLFAPIAVGISTGAYVGSKVAETLFDTIGPYGLLLLAAGVLASTLLLSRWAQETVPDESRSVIVERAADTANKWLGGFAVIARDHYLILIALLVVLLNWITATGEYVLSDWVEEVADAQTAVTAQVFIGTFWANFYSWITLFAFLIQLLLVSRIILAFGIPIALMVAPFMFFAGYLAIGFIPVFALVKWTLITQKSLDYSILNTTRNALLLPASRAAKYEAKTAIDTFFFRFGDLLSAGTVFVGLQILDAQREQFILLIIVLALTMVALAWVIGREYARRASSTTFNVPPTINKPIPDLHWRPGHLLEHSFAHDTFIDADPGDILTFTARLEDGRPLPGWLQFDPHHCTFRGMPPEGISRELIIEVVATDYDQTTVSQCFAIRILG